MRNIIFQNKRGVSNVVAAVVLIVMGLVSATIIFTSVRSLSASLSPEISCAELSISSGLAADSVCYNAEDNEILFKISRQISDRSFISNLEFKASTSEGNQRWVCGESCSDSCVVLNQGSSKTYYLSLQAQEVPEEITLLANGCSLLSKTVESC